MMCVRELTIGLLDLFGRGIAGNPKHFVVITFRHYGAKPLVSGAQGLWDRPRST